ncbi:formin [Acrasis kona]|uniref:Formin n=1 Tax=Acrasis kona TaxID=1008807 RepID=A0AAW2ZCQ3_9EUKA
MKDEASEPTSIGAWFSGLTSYWTSTTQEKKEEEVEVEDNVEFEDFDPSVVNLTKEQLEDMFLEMLEQSEFEKDEIERLFEQTPLRQKYVMLYQRQEDLKCYKIVDDFVDVVEPSSLTLINVQDLRSVLQSKCVDYIKHFLEERDGMGQVHRCIDALLTPYSSASSQPKLFEVPSEIQFELVGVVLDVFSIDNGVETFTNQRDAVKSLSLGLSSPIAKLETKGRILNCLSIICTNSPKGSWLALEAFNHFKLVNREKVRFEYFVFTMQLACSVDENKRFKEGSESYLLECLMFINALLRSTSHDMSTRSTLQKELKQAKLEDLVAQIIKSSTQPKLCAQSEILHNELRDESFMKNLEDPQELANSISTKLQGLPSLGNFTHLLHMLSALAEETVVHEKAYEDWRIIDAMISRAVSRNNTQMQTPSTPQESINELRLQDRLTMQQKNIRRLEKRERETHKRVKLVLNHSNETSSSHSVSTSVNNDYYKETVDAVREYVNNVKDMKHENSILKSKVKELDDVVKFLERGEALLAQSKVGFGTPPSKTSFSLVSDTPPCSPPVVNGENIKNVASPVCNVVPPPPPPPPPFNVGMLDFAPPPPPPVCSPPPPPPPPTSIKAPPPPPPPPGPMTKKVMGAPPPPGKFVNTPKSTGPIMRSKATLPMRNIFWDNVQRQQLEETIFMKNDLAKHAFDMELDASKLQTLFAKQDSSTVMTPRSAAVATPACITFLEPKRSQHVAIVVKQFKMTHQELMDAVLCLDDKVLSESDISFLSQVAPSEEEIEKIKTFDGDANTLAEAERFFVGIQNVCEDLTVRMEAWQFKNTFDEMLCSVRADMEIVISACEELISSKAFHLLLSTILAMGNFLNGDKKISYAFRISSLTKLGDLRATVADKTAGNNLLQYLVYFLIEKEQHEVLRFMDQIPSAKAATRVDATKLRKDIISLTAGLKRLQPLKNKRPINEKDRLPQVMSEFLVEADYAMQDVNSRFEAMEKIVRELAKSYGENTNEMVDGGYVTFFSNISKFVTQFSMYVKSIPAAKARERKLSLIKSSPTPSIKNRKFSLMIPSSPKARDRKSSLSGTTLQKLDLVQLKK